MVRPAPGQKGSAKEDRAPRPSSPHPHHLSWQGFGREQETEASAQEKLPHGRNRPPKTWALVSALSVKTMFRGEGGRPSKQKSIGSATSATRFAVRRHSSRPPPRGTPLLSSRREPQRPPEPPATPARSAAPALSATLNNGARGAVAVISGAFISFHADSIGARSSAGAILVLIVLAAPVE